MSLNGKVAIVTGAGSGFGRATALKFAKEGASLVINDIYLDRAEEVAKEVTSFSSSKPLVAKADVSKSDEVEVMVKKSLDTFGKIDVLVNNAGGAYGGGKLFQETTRGEWETMLDRNLYTTLSCTRAVVNHMIDQRTGRIINVASYTGVIGGARYSIYAAAKAAVICFTKALAMEVAKHNILVNAVAPGPAKTRGFYERAPSKELVNEMTKTVAIGRFGEPEDIADVIWFLASDASRYVTGQCILVTGGYVNADHLH